MFTGIVTDLGRVRAVSPAGDTRIEISTGYDPATIAIGASIACSGACLTVIETGADWFAVMASAETMARTTLGSWRPGMTVNLERSLKMGDELGGHLVSGHVDGIGTVARIVPEGDSHRVTIEMPGELAGFVAEKGSIAVDGVSLTVNDVDSRQFGVNIIPHTWDVTRFGHLHPGATVNLEIDLIARYVARLLSRP